MSKKRINPTNRIADVRKAKGFTQQLLADQIGSHWITVSKLERGVMRLSDEWRAAIAKALEVDEDALLHEPRRLPTVTVEGVVGEGGKVFLLDDEDTSEHFQIDTRYFTHHAFRWLTVAGDALDPWYQDGDRLCTVAFEGVAIEDVPGRLLVCWYETKAEAAVTIGTVEPTRTKGRYNIYRVNDLPLRDVVISQIALIVMAIYYHGQNTLIEPSELVPPFDLGPVGR